MYKQYCILNGDLAQYLLVIIFVLYCKLTLLKLQTLFISIYITLDNKDIKKFVT